MTGNMKRKYSPIIDLFLYCKACGLDVNLKLDWLRHFMLSARISLLDEDGREVSHAICVCHRWLNTERVVTSKGFFKGLLELTRTNGDVIACTPHSVLAYWLAIKDEKEVMK